MTDKHPEIHRVLFVCPEPAWPVNSGPRHMLYHQLCEASRRWRCLIVGFTSNDEATKAWEELCGRLPQRPDLFLFDRSHGFKHLCRRLSAVALLRPPAAEDIRSKSAYDKINEICRSGEVDVVHFDRFTTVQYGAAAGALPTVLVPYDAFSMMAARNAQILGWRPAGIRARWQKLVFERLERGIYSEFSVIATSSDIDTAWLKAEAGLSRVETIGIGVGEEFLRRSDVASAGEGSVGIVVMGVFRIAGVRAGLREWLRHVLPRLRTQLGDVPITLWGEGASRFATETRDPSLSFVDFVEDYSAYLRRADIVVYPQRSGSGIQTKVQQAMACRRPVVARRAMLDPLGAVDGVHGFAADDNIEMCDRIVTLWRDASLRCRIGAAASRLIAEKFSAAQIGERLESVYATALGHAEQPASNSPAG